MTGHEDLEGEQRYSPTIFLWMGVGGQRHAPAAVTQGVAR